MMFPTTTLSASPGTSDDPGGKAGVSKTKKKAKAGKKKSAKKK